MAATFGREDESVVWMYSSSNFGFQDCLTENVVCFEANNFFQM